MELFLRSLECDSKPRKVIARELRPVSAVWVRLQSQWVHKVEHPVKDHS